MQHGFAVLVGGKPKGIIGMPYSYAESSRDRYKIHHPDSQIVIVPVYFGESKITTEVKGGKIA